MKKPAFKRKQILTHMGDDNLNVECGANYTGQGITWNWDNVNCKKCLACKIDKTDKARFLYKEPGKDC